MREPSIHITRTVFLALAKQAGIKVSKPKVDMLFRVARGYALDSRTLLEGGTKKKERANKRVSGNIQSANLAADLAYGIRIQRHHVGVTKTKQTDPTWGQVRELVQTLEIFCNDNGLDQREGYLAFLNTGFDLMDKGKKGLNYQYWASWMLKHADLIVDTYNSIRDIKNDQYSRETQEIMSIYTTKVSEMTGMFIDYSKNPNDYIHFVKARQLADKYGIDYETYMDAQFESLAFCNGIPRLIDIDNDKAEERLAKYVAKAGIQVRNPALSEDTWEDFKK